MESPGPSLQALPLETLQQVTQHLSPKSLGRFDIAYAGSRALPLGTLRKLQRELQIPEGKVLEFPEFLLFPNITRVRGPILLRKPEQIEVVSQKIRGSLFLVLEFQGLALVDVDFLKEILSIRILLYPESETSFVFRQPRGPDVLYRYNKGSLSVPLNPNFPFPEESLFSTVLERMPLTAVDLPMNYYARGPPEARRRARENINSIYSILATKKLRELVLRTEGAPTGLDPKDFPYLTTIRIGWNPFFSRSIPLGYDLFDGPNPAITTITGVTLSFPEITGEQLIPFFEIISRPYPNVQTLEITVVIQLPPEEYKTEIEPALLRYVGTHPFIILTVEYEDVDIGKAVRVTYKAKGRNV